MVDKIDGKLMPLMIDQTHAIGKMGSVLGKLGKWEGYELNRLVARQ